MQSCSQVTLCLPLPLSRVIRQASSYRSPLMAPKVVSPPCSGVLPHPQCQRPCAPTPPLLPPALAVLLAPPRPLSPLPGRGLLLTLSTDCVSGRVVGDVSLSLTPQHLSSPHGPVSHSHPCSCHPQSLLSYPEGFGSNLTNVLSGVILVAA